MISVQSPVRNLIFYSGFVSRDVELKTNKKKHLEVRTETLASGLGVEIYETKRTRMDMVLFQFSFPQYMRTLHAFCDIWKPADPAASRLLGPDSI